MLAANSKARITTIDPENTTGFRKLFFWGLKRQTRGFVPGVFKIITVNMHIFIPIMWLVNYLGMRKSAPLSRVQQEMVATVVNGIIGGAP